MPVLDAHMMDYFSRSPEQTRRIGMRLGGALQAGDVICLQGDLGAGKTTFVQGIAQGWRSLDAVSSPTFIIVNVYRRGTKLVYFIWMLIASSLRPKLKSWTSTRCWPWVP